MITSRKNAESPRALCEQKGGCEEGVRQEWRLHLTLKNAFNVATDEKRRNLLAAVFVKKKIKKMNCDCIC
jgi:hypothetical protein